VSGEAPVRWSDELGWLFRCESCAKKRQQAYWPLEPKGEFFEPSRGMVRCNACYREAIRLKKREQYRDDAAHREAKKRSERAYRASMTQAERARHYRLKQERQREIDANSSPEELERRRNLQLERQRRYRERQRAIAA
jgi:hypothetical protein